ncbi:related to monocarboxylate transporter 4 [Phialocephala subalpina]|uniref:Related to monocarboxylate transporter 4 n=1 Tax=Phialocephala subalpina TaxID=576137 RepID=A0A1L7WYM2_9HELO|nr:related to monocarboxylate transporter 4 [Phialocephala subalpina]
MAAQPPISSSSSYMFDKEHEDADTPSIHSESSHTDAKEVERERQNLSLTEKLDIEAYPNEANEPASKEGIVTRTSTKSSWKDPGPPPDGGVVGWTQAALGHLVIMNTWGFINSFGVFQTYYVTSLSRTPSDISWVGSIQVFLLFFIGTFTGRLTDAGYFRPVFLVGSFLAIFGLFMTSLSTSYWQLFLAQGVCCGLGNGCLFCPSLSLLSTYFSKKRSLALGIAAAGSATGGMVFPAMVQQLLPRIGFAWTMRSLGFIQLGCLLVCNIGIRPRIAPRKTGALVDWKSFKELPYVLFAAGMFFNFWGVYFAFYYIGSFARSIIDLPYTESINLLIVLNGVGVLGRIIPNFLADRFFGPMNSIIPVILISSALCFCWIAVDSRGGLYAWAVVYGLMGAAIQSLFPATLSSLTQDPRMQGTRMGMVFSIVSFAVLTGPPIAGQLIQRKGGSYTYAQIFAGVDLIIGCCFLLAARYAKSPKLMVKL